MYAPTNLWLWIFGLAWSFGFLGFSGPSTTLTAEVFPNRVRGVAVSDLQRPDKPFAGAGPIDAMGRAARTWQLRRCI
jgi:hypothetical protein